MRIARLALLAVWAVPWVSVGSASAGDITTGLLAWWKMDGPTDPNDLSYVADSSGNDYHLVKSGDVQWENNGLAFYCGPWSYGVKFPDETNNSSITAQMMFGSVSTVITVSFGINSSWNLSKTRQDIFTASMGVIQDEDENDAPKILFELPNGYDPVNNPQGDAWLHAGKKVAVGGGSKSRDKIIRWDVTDPASASYIPMFGERAVITLTKDTQAGSINPDTGLPTGEITLYVNGEWVTTTTHTASWDGNHDVSTTLEGMNLFRMSGHHYKQLIDGTTLDNFMIFNRALTAEDVAMLAPPVEYPPGDANRDGKVDQQDASILAANWQKIGGATWSQGDFNDDGNVDDLDASILAANWPLAAGAAVPEPSVLVLLAGVALAVLLFSTLGRYS